MQRIILTIIFHLTLSTTLHAASSRIVNYVGSDYRPMSTLASVSFAKGSSSFKPDRTVIALLDHAKEASMVVISGRTSTNGFSPKDEQLALNRAVSARNYLVGRGVSPLKIQINYVSAADFIVDNSTDAGTYINQRVDIKLIYVPLL